MGCRLCPRECDADRVNGEKGRCGETMEIRAARAALHMWEEPCISGPSGSGTVFFTGCPLKCLFCQNASIAASQTGKAVSTERLSEIFLTLQSQKACNINLVTPTHFAPRIAEALRLAKSRGLTVPIVYNTGGYEKPETLRLLDGLVDIYLPDLKYVSSRLSARYSDAPDYFSAASAALAEMFRQVGTPVFSEDGNLLLRGIIVRHLMLPGHLADSRRVVKYLYETYGNKVYLSLMNQYTPVRFFPDRPELNRRVSHREYRELIDYCLALGVENAYIQEGETASESFIPPFDCEGI